MEPSFKPTPHPCGLDLTVPRGQLGCGLFRAELARKVLAIGQPLGSVSNLFQKGPWEPKWTGGHCQGEGLGSGVWPGVVGRSFP